MTPAGPRGRSAMDLSQLSAQLPTPRSIPPLEAQPQAGAFDPGDIERRFGRGGQPRRETEDEWEDAYRQQASEGLQYEYPGDAVMSVPRIPDPDPTTDPKWMAVGFPSPDNPFRCFLRASKIQFSCILPRLLVTRVRMKYLVARRGSLS